MIEDGNAIFYYLKERPATFNDISSKVFDPAVKRSDTIFRTDMYTENSVKGMERNEGEKLILRGENTKKSFDWKKFLSNDENKVQLIKMVCRGRKNDSYSDKFSDKKVIAVFKGKVFL